MYLRERTGLFRKDLFGQFNLKILSTTSNILLDYNDGLICKKLALNTREIEAENNKEQCLYDYVKVLYPIQLNLLGKQRIAILECVIKQYLKNICYYIATLQNTLFNKYSRVSIEFNPYGMQTFINVDMYTPYDDMHGVNEKHMEYIEAVLHQNIKYTVTYDPDIYSTSKAMELLGKLDEEFIKQDAIYKEIECKA
jgi:hypothetical protein|nr:MAG TPA: hypothetical protein [Caudoviricetes sp.]